MTVTTLLTDRSDITRTRWRESDPVPLGDGQVRFTVEHVGFSANNVTYAALGDRMQYWDFFPTGEQGWGCVPVWGYARACESRCPDVPVGRRVFGFLPFASEVVMTPGHVGPRGFTDDAAHRSGLHRMYNAYTAVEDDPGHPPELDGHNALLRPLFMTSFLIARWLADEDFFGAEALVLSSASSKTAYGVAFAVSRLPGRRPQVTGLTSAGHVGSTERLGLYDRVLAYEDLDALDAERPTVYVDLAGNGDLRRAVHERCGGLRHSCAVGITHWRATPADSKVPGPAPVFFFAPAELERQVAAQGRAEFFTAAAEAMSAFVTRVADPSDPLMTITWHRGPDAARAVYDAVVAGREDPAGAPMIAW